MPKNSFHIFFHSDLGLWPFDLKFSPQLFLSSSTLCI